MPCLDAWILVYQKFLLFVQFDFYALRDEDQTRCSGEICVLVCVARCTVDPWTGYAFVVS